MSEDKTISGSGSAEGGASTSAAATRVTLTDEQLAAAARDELLVYCKQQQAFVDSQTTRHQAELAALRQQLADSSMREKVLSRRLATKEHDLQEYAAQLLEMKRREAPGVAALRQTLLDPAVNLLVQRLRRELADTRKKLEDTQGELSAWKFTPDSNTGKRLMAKCRLLYQENEELGRVIASGRVAKLEGELALQKSFCEEVKKSQSELDEFLQELDEDVEGMQSTIMYLQQELRKAKEQLVAYSEQQRKSPPPQEQPQTPAPINGTASSRGRAPSEDSDDQPLSKKIKRESTPDDTALANGQADASESPA